ncbi:MAG: XRE family transcriptional regulator [Proteobacteria bacterium]|nr:MAG: XRE family transcriptional regulator [Pseudomonadota bacterium]
MHNNYINDSKDAAEVIKKRRGELGITQKQLADFCNLSHNGISKLEGGETDIKLSTLLKMSVILGFKITLEMDE